MDVEHEWIACAHSVIGRIGKHAVESSATRAFPSHGFRSSKCQVREASVCLSYRHRWATFGGNDIELVRIGFGLTDERYLAAASNIGLDPIAVGRHDTAEIQRGHCTFRLEAPQPHGRIHIATDQHPFASGAQRVMNTFLSSPVLISRPTPPAKGASH